MEGTNFPDLQKAIQSSLVATTRTSGTLASEDLPFHRSLSSPLSTQLDRQNARLLHLAQNLLGAATSASESVRQPPRLSSIEDVDGNWRAVVDVIDSLLERADTALDEFTGAVRRLSPGAVERAKNGVGEGRSGKGMGRVVAAVRGQQEIEKPQLKFENVPRNDEKGVFVPLLETKPHAMVPLEEVKEGTHPYQTEIGAYTYPSSVYTHAEPIPYHPFGTTTATYVDTEEAMYQMLGELKQATEIAIDLEHHDLRSYIGIVSLMQISTRNKDWIIDTLVPWRRKLNILNSVFANPNILKVLHGAYMDVVWLQRDLGLYLVGLFDTHYACRALGYTGGSLAFLLKRFADVDAQKQYQTADWRVRPLPQELLDYARSDTHYLLYIYDNMRNELIEKTDLSKPNKEGDKLNDVLVKSSETALQTYEHPVYDPELGQGPNGWYKLPARTPALLSKEQFSVFRAVHQWRDQVAREQDDSVHWVMPNHQIFSIAKSIPTTRAELLGIAQPGTQTVKLRADELLDVVLRAKAEGGKEGAPDMMETLNKVEPQFPRRSHKVPDVAPSHSVAGFLPDKQTATPPTSNGVASVGTTALPLRSTVSTFWGRAFPSPQQKRQESSAAVDVDLRVPLPPLTAEVFADPGEMVATPVKESAPTSSAAATPTETPKEEEEDVFILKQLGKKRKRPAEEMMDRGADGMAANNDEVAIDPEFTIAREKAEKRAAKKAAKRAKKAAEANGDAAASMNVDDEVEEEAPFDYENAPSVLNPPRETKEQMRDRRKKIVDPYKKSMDAPKGLPRVQKERAGRSMTFKR